MDQGVCPSIGSRSPGSIGRRGGGGRRQNTHAMMTPAQSRCVSLSHSEWWVPRRVCPATRDRVNPQHSRHKGKQGGSEQRDDAHSDTCRHHAPLSFPKARFDDSQERGPSIQIDGMERVSKASIFTVFAWLGCLACDRSQIAHPMSPFAHSFACAAPSFIFASRPRPAAHAH